MPRQAKLEGEATRLVSIEEVDTRLAILRDAVTTSTGGKITDYNPLVAMAIIANDDKVSLKTRADLHTRIAEFIYPKVRTLDFSNPEGKKMKITIEIEGYAQKDQKPIEADFRRIEHSANSE